jgi:hypothetical protein
MFGIPLEFAGICSAISNNLPLQMTMGNGAALASLVMMLIAMGTPLI